MQLAAWLPIVAGAAAGAVPEYTPSTLDGVDIKHGPFNSEAAFSLDNPSFQGLPTWLSHQSGQQFELQFGSIFASERDPCGEGNVSLNGIPLQITDKLPLTLDGSQEHFGSGLSSIPWRGERTSLPVRWQTLCLFTPGDVAGAIEPTRILSVQLIQDVEDMNSGFSISYQQIGRPWFLRYHPQYINIENARLDYKFWQPTDLARTISSVKPNPVGHGNGPLDDGPFTADPEHIQSEQYRELFGSLFKILKEKTKAVTTKAHKIFSTCHFAKIKATVHQAAKQVESTFQDQSPLYIQSDATAIDYDTVNEPTPASHLDDLHPHAPSPTRSLDEPISTSSNANQHVQSQSQSHRVTISDLNPHINLKVIALLFPCLIITSVLLWLFLRFRDPRRRAERAAEKEERHNQRLYRRAARNHKWRSFLCRVRRHNHPTGACNSIQYVLGTGVQGTWNEKRSLVLQQESLLNNVTDVEIRRLCHQTLPTRRPHLTTLHPSLPSPTSLSAAEEGYAFPDSRSLRSVRSAHSLRSSCDSHDPDRRRRRQRRRTNSSGASGSLPDYVSDVTQPPGYDEEVGLEGALISDGWRRARIMYAHESAGWREARKGGSGRRERSLESSVIDTSTRGSLRSSRSGSLDLGKV